MENNKMVPSGNVGITPRQEVEQVLAVFRTADGETVTYDNYVEVYAAIRPHCASAEDCNACALHVFQVLDNEDLPKGVTRAMIVDCAMRAKGFILTMESLIEQLLESNAPEREDDEPLQSAMDKYVAASLDTPVDHGIVYRPEDGASDEDTPTEDEGGDEDDDA